MSSTLWVRRLSCFFSQKSGYCVKYEQETENENPENTQFFYVLFFTVIIGIALIYTACDKKKEPFETPRAESGSGKSGQSYSYDIKSSGNSDELEDYDEDNDTLYKFEKSKINDKIKPIDEKPMKLPYGVRV